MHILSAKFALEQFHKCDFPARFAVDFVGFCNDDCTMKGISEKNDQILLLGLQLWNKGTMQQREGNNGLG